MIFKTGTTDFKKIYGVVNDIINIDSILDSKTGLLIPNTVNSFSSAIQGLNLQQAQLALSTKNLTKEQMNQVLVQAGLIASEDKIQAELLQSALSQANLSAEKQKAILTYLNLMNAQTNELFITNACTKEELLNMLATQGVTGANETAILSALGLAGANETATVSFGLFSAATWAQVKAQLALMASNPITWIVAVAGAIYGGVKAYNALTETEEEATEALENAKSVSDSYRSSIDDVMSSQNELASNTNDIKQRFAELSQGVDSMSNKNLSLSTDDYKEFLDLNSQLANLFPTLTKGYDENGNAILGLGGDIDTVTGKIQALAEQQERLANKEILDNLENYVNGDDNGGGQLEEIERLKKEKEKAEKLADTYGHFQDLFNGKTVSTQDLGINEISNIFDRADLDYTKLDMNEKGWNISSLTPEELNKVKTIWENYYQELFSEAQTAKDELANANAEMSSEMMYWVQSLPQYTDSNDESMQTAMMNMVNGIDWSSFGASDYEGAKNFIQQLVLAPLSELSNDPAVQSQFSSAISGLYSLNTTDMPADEAEKTIQSYIQQIMDILNQFKETEDQLSLDDTYSMFGFSDMLDNGADFDSSLNKIAGSNTSEMQKLSNYTKEFTLAQQQAWVTATNGAENAENAIKQYEQSIQSSETNPLSFSEAWKQLENGTGVFADDESISNTHDNLLELAKSGQLTAKTLQETDGADTFLAQIGIGAEDATEKIQNLLSTQEKLAAFSQGLSGLGNAFEEFQENNFVSAETLNSLPDAFKNLKGYDLFSQIVGDPKSGTQKIQNAFDQIVTEYLQSQNILDSATSQNKNEIIANLQQAGIGNAEDLVNSYVNSMEENKPLIQGASDEILQYLSNNNETDVNNFIAALQAKNANYTELASALGEDNATLIAKFGSQYGDDLANWISLLSQKQEAYNQFVQEYNNSLEEQQNYFDGLDMPVERAVANGTADTTILTQNANKVSTTKQNMDNAGKDLEKTNKETKKKITGKLAKMQGKISVSGYQPKSSAGSNNTNNNNTTPKETKQSFDWLDRYITVLTQRIDLLKAKLENLFSVNAKNKNLTKQIKAVSKEIKAYSKEASIYNKKANAYAANKNSKGKRNISKDLQKQIDNGKFKGKTYGQLVEEYTEKDANKIQKYMDLKDKAATAKQNKAQAIKTRRELKIQKRQNRVDYYDSLNSKYDAQIENASTATKKNDLEDKKIDATKRSYNQQIKKAELEYGKNSAQVKTLKAQKKTAVNEIKIEKQQNLQNEADAYRDMLEAQAENATTAEKKNSYLAKEVQYINQSYNAQIKIAQLEGNTAKEEELKAKKKKELLENEKQQLQNLSDQQSAQYALNQQREANANSAREKNQFEADSRKNLKAQYDYEIKIAEKNGDLVEQERLRLELEQKMEESYQRQIDNIKEEYDLIIGLNDARKSTIDSKIAALQANGYGISAELYEQQIKIESENLQISLDKIEHLSAEMPNLSGNALEQAEIDLETEIKHLWETQKNIGDYRQAINDINLSKLERTGTMLEYKAKDLKFTQDILSHSDFTLSDQDIGGLSIEGLSSAAITFAQMSNNSEQIANAWDEINEIQGQINRREINYDEGVSQINDRIEQIHEWEKANYDFAESIKNIVINSLNSLSDALDKNISEYKDSLQAQKNLYDYRKKVADQLKSITSLEKQLAALQGSDTEEARARIQKLQIQLENEQQNLKDMEYDKYIQDQEEMLDKVSEDFQDFIASVTNMGVSEICTAMGQAIIDNEEHIYTAISDALDKSTSINGLSKSMSGLNETLQGLDYSGKVSTDTSRNTMVEYEYTDNNGNKFTICGNNYRNPGTVIRALENGNYIYLPDNQITKTQTMIDTAIKSGNDNGKQKKKITDTINSYNTYAYGRSSDYNSNALLRYLNSLFGKTPTEEQEASLIQELGATDGYDAIRKMVFMGFCNDNALIPDDILEEYERYLLSKNIPNLAENNNQLYGFSHGGVASELNRIALANGDDGWATLKRGESVLTPAQTEQFRKLTENLIPLNTVANSVASLPSNPVPTHRSPAANTTTVRNVDIHLDGSHIMDADSFIQTLHNPRVLREVSSGVSSQLNSVMSNKLGNF